MPAIVEEANPPRPLVSSHSRSSALLRLPQTPGPILTPSAPVSGAANRFAGHGASVDAVVEDHFAVDDYVGNANRVLVRLHKVGFVGDCRRIEDGHVAPIADLQHSSIGDVDLSRVHAGHLL